MNLALLIALVALSIDPAPARVVSAPLPGQSAKPGGFAFERIAALDVGRAPHQIAFSSDGSTAAIAAAGSDEIALVDVATLAVTARLPAEGTPLAVTWLPGDRALLTSRFGTGGIARLALPEGAAARSFETSPGISLAVGPRPDGTWLFAVERANELIVVDPERDEFAARYDVGARPFPPGVTSDGRLAFVPDHDDGTVTVIDLWNERVVATTDVGERPTGATVLPGDIDCAVAVRGTDTIAFVNTASFEVVDELSGLGAEPFSVVVAPDGRLAFVNSTAEHHVAVVALPERRVVARVPTGEIPIALAVHPSGETLWVACEGAHVLEVFRVPDELRASPSAASAAETTVGVLGTIHGEHLTSEGWGLTQLREAILSFAPDAVLTEIPPNRFDRIARDWRERRAIEDPRVLRFPEYVHVLLPLWDELGCAIEPCAAWTSEMNDLRSARLAAFENRPEYAAYAEAKAAVEELLAADPIVEDDPHVLHSPVYDQRARTELGPYDRFLNDWIGPGGWSNINAAHLALIEAAIDRHAGERLLVTFGAGHKHRILERLRARADVRLVDMTPHLPDARSEAAIEARVRAEVNELHRFFEQWFNGEVEDTVDVYARFTDVMLPGFEIVDPGGITTPLEPLLEGLRAAHGRFADPPIRIWIENVAVEPDADAPDRYRVTYEEWQDAGNGARGRTSRATVVETQNTPHGLAWLHVHETWMPQ